MPIVSDNGRVIGTIEHLALLYDLAVCRTERLGFSFKGEDYKWILGVKVLQAIEDNTYYIMSEFPNKRRLIFGIEVETDYSNPDNVQLWENITNKL